MKKYLLTCSMALTAVCARAGVGVSQIPGLQGDGPVTVYYPTAADDQPQRFGPFTLNLAREAAPVRGNDRLIVMSHGSGGSPWVHADLARALVNAGFVVAMPEHRGDNYKDATDRGPESWKQRPAEVSRAIDATARDPRFAPLLALDKVGMYGMSAGGHTALSLAGGRWSPALFRQHCEAHIADDFPSCVGLITRLNGGILDGLKMKVALGVIANGSTTPPGTPTTIRAFGPSSPECLRGGLRPRVAGDAARAPGPGHCRAGQVAVATLSQRRGAQELQDLRARGRPAPRPATAPCFHRHPQWNAWTASPPTCWRTRPGSTAAR